MEQDTHLQDIYNLSPSYLFSFSNTGYITRINQTFLSHLGYSEDEITGKKKFTELLTVGSRIFFDTHFFPLIKLHGKFDEIFLSFLSVDKQEIPVLMNVLLSGDNTIFEIHCGGLQIAQRNRFEKEILEAKHVAEKALLENETLIQLKEQLESHQLQLETQLRKLSHKNKEHLQVSTVLSHDLQEPVRKVALFSNKLLEQEELSEQSRDYLRRIEDAVLKMRHRLISIQQFLALDHQPVVPVKVDLNDIVKRSLLKASVNTNFTIYQDIHSLPEIRGNPQLLEDLFYQVFHNAVKFNDLAKSALKLSVTSAYSEQNIFIELEHKYKYKDFLKIMITDNGIGFDNNLSEEVFALFRKAHDNEEGAGLGLAYCRKIVGIHEGFISAKSQPGVGTTITLLFPVEGNMQG